MIQELQQIRRDAGTVLPWVAVIVGVLVVLMNYGLSGLLSVAIVLGFLFGPSLLWGHADDEKEDDRHDEDIFNKPARYGPTTEDLYYDPLHHHFQGNCFHKRFHGKD